MMRKIALLLAFCMIFVFAGCGNTPAAPEISEESEAVEESTPSIEIPSFEFADIHHMTFPKGSSYKFEGEASVPSYEVEKGLSNIVNLNQFRSGTDEQGDYYFALELSPKAAEYIENNGFVVMDSHNNNEYYGRYEQNRYNFIPSFITTDSALHTFHLLYDCVLKDVERSTLTDKLTFLTKSMYEASLNEAELLKDTGLENAALRNAAYFAVAGKLLDESFEVSEELKEVVNAELKLIEAHEGVAASPVVNMGQDFSDEKDFYMCDYSQFIPRGHYTQSEELKKYFKASMWYGQITFRSKSADEVKSAILMTGLLSDGERAENWKKIYDTVNFFVGECDDITPIDYMEVLDGSIYGPDEMTVETLCDEDIFSEIWENIKLMPPPSVNSIPIWAEEIEPDRDEAVTGFRFLGQRFTLDADIFQRLMDRSVKGRMLPNALDVPAAFGSDEAFKILAEDYNVFEYEDYEGSMDEVREHISSMDEEVWTSNLYYSWLNVLNKLIEEKGEGYPMFMTNEAWARKDLNAFLGSFTELKHDTLLYSKQPMAEMGGGGDEAPTPPDDRGYVEPAPEVYGNLSNLAKQTREGLSEAGLLTEEAGEVLELYQDVVSTLRDLSIKELTGEEMTEEDYALIRLYGGQLEHIWDVAKEDEMESAGNPGKEAFLYSHPDAVVADVATDPNGSCLEEATGYAKTIVAAFPRDGEVVLGVGTVFSHYEFTVPMEERMTDNDWHERLKNGDIPPVDNWKTSFICVENEEAD